MQLMVEEMMMNAWPALRTVIYDGWLVQFSDGYTKRANSVYPMYGQARRAEESSRKIEAVERLYADQGQPAIFKLTDAPAQLQLDEQLSLQGYRKNGLTAIMTQSLASTPEPVLHTVEMSVRPTERWQASYASMAGVSDATSKTTMGRILDRIVQPACYFILYEGERNIACGSAVLDRDYVGIYEVATDPAFRNQGYGEQLLLNILKWARLNGASHAYLAVVVDNAPAVRLYEKVGFAEQYRYWYRTKEIVRG